MNNEELFKKYSDGNHWENHPITYADEFVKFLSFTIQDSIMGTKSNFRLIDLGCGNGRDVNRFREYQIKAIGLDNNADTVQRAKELNGQEHFYIQDIENLPYEDNSQDAYYCINVIHYVDASKVLGEIYRTLKPGGYAFIHFNLCIFGENKSFDYHQKRTDVYELITNFEIVEEKVFFRTDVEPLPHTHRILQVIIKKN